MITTVFFDVGATLLTPRFDEGITFANLANRLDIAIDPQEVIAKVPLMYELYDQLYEQDDSFWSDNVRAKAIWIEMYEYLAALLDIPSDFWHDLAETTYKHYFSASAWKLYDDVRPTLEKLGRSGFRMGLISNWDANLDAVIEGLGIAHFFETIIASADVCLHKPMPEIFELALAQMGISAEQAAHVGDHIYADVEGAARVGMTAMLLDRDNSQSDYPGTRITSLLDIEPILMAL